MKDKKDEMNNDEVIFEESEEVEVERSQNDKLKELREKLKVCEKEKMSHLEETQRVKADFLNSKRRLAEQLESDTDKITGNFIGSLLPLCDSFDMAMSDVESWEACDEKWRKGIEAIRAQLNTILTTYNVIEIKARGEKFNPEDHQAVSNEPVENDTEVDTVTSVLQKGYRMNGKVLRPATVTVGVKN